MKAIFDYYLVGALIIVLYSACIHCKTNLDGYTYEFDEEPLSFGQDQNQLEKTYELADSTEHNVLDVALVFDSSYTITTSGWYKIKQAAKQLVDGLDISPQGTHVSLMKFSTDVETFRIFEQDADKEKLKKEIDDLTYDGEWSRLDLACKAVDEHVFAADSGARLGDVPKAVILFTDGKADGPTQPDEEVDWHQRVLAAVQPLHKKNIIVFAVSVGGFADQATLAAITASSPPNEVLSDQSKSSERVFDLNSIADVVQGLDKLSVKVPKVVVTQTVVVTTTETSTPVTQVVATETTIVEVTPSSTSTSGSSVAQSPEASSSPGATSSPASASSEVPQSSSVSSVLSPSPSVASSQASISQLNSLAASATPSIENVQTTVALTQTVTTIVQITQTVLKVQKGTPIIITAKKRRLKRSKPSSSKWYHRIIPPFLKRWLQVKD